MISRVHPLLLIFRVALKQTSCHLREPGRRRERRVTSRAFAKSFNQRGANVPAFDATSRRQSQIEVVQTAAKKHTGRSPFLSSTAHTREDERRACYNFKTRRA